MSLAVVIVAAGIGRRFGAPKQFAVLDGKPLLLHSLQVFDAMADVVERIVVLPPDMVEHSSLQWMNRMLLHPVKIVSGGEARADSVRAGIEAVESGDLVAVHDGARPFIPTVALRACIDLLLQSPEYAAAVVASRVTDTLKAIEVDSPSILSTIDREKTVRAETPQVCRVQLLREALSNLAGQATDEAQALERAGHRTAYVLHDEINLKITRPFDLVLAEAWLKHHAIDEGSRACYRGEENE